MATDIVCMSLGSVPPGEQRSRFLAVGLADQTVRIISLDPSVIFFPLFSLSYTFYVFIGHTSTFKHAGPTCSTRKPLHY